MRRISSLWRWRSTGTGCPGRLWSLLLWRYSRPAWTRSSTTYCRWPCFGRRVGLDDPQRSLQPYHSVILWFCEWAPCAPDPKPQPQICRMGMKHGFTKKTWKMIGFFHNCSKRYCIMSISSSSLCQNTHFFKSLEQKMMFSASILQFLLGAASAMIKRTLSDCFIFLLFGMGTILKNLRHHRSAER